MFVSGYNAGFHWINLVFGNNLFFHPFDNDMSTFDITFYVGAIVRATLGAEGCDLEVLKSLGGTYEKLFSQRKSKKFPSILLMSQEFGHWSPFTVYIISILLKLSLFMSMKDLDKMYKNISHDYHRELKLK